MTSTDMRDYHTFDHEISCLSIPELTRKQQEIMNSWDSLRELCIIDEISPETYWQMVTIIRKRYAKIGERIRLLQSFAVAGLDDTDTAPSVEG